jgi:peptidyl-prolyl cis-trans isomerase SurA
VNIIKSNLILAFIIVQTHVSAGPILIDHVAAVVVDEPILRSQVIQLQKSIEKNPALSSAYRLTPADLSYTTVLDRMIEEKVVQVTVKELEIQVSDTELETQVNSIAQQNKITRKQLEDSVLREGISFEEYRKNIKGSMERRNLFDRELRRGGGVTESEVKSLYEKTAPTELKLSVISIKNNAESRKIGDVLVKEIKDKKKTLEAADSEFAGDSLGWIPVDSINSKFGNIKNASAGDVIGPVLIEGQLQILLIYGNRKGSAEGFEKAKGELMMQAQSLDFERRFQSWLEKKKSELNIVLNKI